MKFVAAVVGVLVLLGFFSAISALVLREIPVANKEPLMLLVGSLGTMAGMVVGYFYGSSSGSDRKTELMAGGQSQ